MASFRSSTRRITHHDYELDSPAHISEIGKAIAVAQQDIERELGDVADEILQVEARDDKVVITWYSEENLP